MGFTSDRDKEDALLTARLEDALRLCRDRYRPQFVGFLDERQRALAQTLERRLGEVSLCFYGGRADAERVVAGFFPAFMEPGAGGVSHRSSLLPLPEGGKAAA